MTQRVFYQEELTVNVVGVSLNFKIIILITLSREVDTTSSLYRIDGEKGLLHQLPCSGILMVDFWLINRVKSKSSLRDKACKSKSGPTKKYVIQNVTFSCVYKISDRVWQFFSGKRMVSPRASSQFRVVASKTLSEVLRAGSACDTSGGGRTRSPSLFSSTSRIDIPPCQLSCKERQNIG